MVERQQVILVRLRIAGTRCACPPSEGSVARVGIDHRFAQPGVERLGLRIGRAIAGKAAHVVITLTAAEDQHALLAQRLQRPSDRQVRRGIEAALQRELHERNLGRRVHHLERHEYTVILAARRLAATADARRREQLAHAGGERRAAWAGHVSR